MEKQWLFFSELKDTTLRNADQSKSASVDDAVLDLQSGQIALFISGKGGFLGMGENKIALPADAVQLLQDEGRFNIAEDQMNNAPGVVGEWPQRFDSDFIDAVYQHFGYSAFTGR